MRAALIGGGVSGLAAAVQLKAGGVDVRVFDKGRGPGGRMSTRRAQTPLGEARFDHGAQFFTARDPKFQTVVAELEAGGFAAPWRGVFHRDGVEDVRSEPRYVGAPGMNGVVKGLAARVGDVAWGRRVTRIEGSARAWTLAFEDSETMGPFDAVVVATPAEQAGPLLDGVADDFAAQARVARSAPCWAAMLAFDAPLATPFDGARRSSGPIGWMARNSTKPGRDDVEAWVVHGAPDWSRDHLEESAEDVSAWLTAEFRAQTGAPAPVFAAAHRWRYAQIETAAEDAFGWNPATGIGCCGDWRLGPRVEAAWLSGDALGGAIASS